MTGILLAALLLATAHPAAAAENGPIAFASDDALWRLDGGVEQRLPNGEGGGWPAWSPDGSRIAFTSLRRDGIWVMNADGTSLRRVTTSPSLDLEPTWSPDGRRFVFVLRGELWTEAVGGTDRRRLPVAPGADARPDWSPDGTQIAFLSSQGSPTGHYRLWRVDADGENRRLLTPDRESVSALSWAPR